MVKNNRKKAHLIFEDGTTFEGWSCAAEGQATAPVHAHTEVVGHQELITDPAHAGKILLMTMPQIGNYGVNASDSTSDTVPISGLVVREMCYEPSNFRAEKSLPEFLDENDIVALDGVDTRAVMLYLREHPDAVGTIKLLEGEVV
ncbi:MAG: hypothetical protein FWD41_04870 [Actinomycetia bacterium]|nr:hypothetical protein [Actinomycetes bacterium]